MSSKQSLRRAIEWIGRQGRHDPEFLEFTAQRFDLSPTEEQFLLDEFSEAKAETQPPASSQAHAIRNYSFLKVFADGHIDAHELAMVERLALQDGQVDEAERLTLSRLFSRIREEDTEPETWTEIQAFKRTYQIP